MAKRSGDALTGGTKDVSPQFLVAAVSMTAANTAFEVTLGTPIVRVGPQTSGQAIIMEVLKIFVQYPNIDQDNAAATTRLLRWSVSTRSSGGTPAILPLSNPSALMFGERVTRNAFTAAGTGTLDSQEDPCVVDLTDGAGHGVLVATDNLFIQVETTNQAAASNWGFRFLYRFKKVSLVEYIGIGTATAILAGLIIYGIVLYMLHLR